MIIAQSLGQSGVTNDIPLNQNPVNRCFASESTKFVFSIELQAQHTRL